MTRTNSTIREITFAEHTPFLLVPPDMLAEVIARCQEGPELLLSLNGFFPADLVNYLGQVLEINRNLPPISPALLGTQSTAFPPENHALFHSGAKVLTDTSASDEILSLMLIQLSSMHIDRQLWFSRLKYELTEGNETALLAQYTPGAQEIRQEIGPKGGTFIYRPAEERKFCGTLSSDFQITVHPAEHQRLNGFERNF